MYLQGTPARIPVDEQHTFNRGRSLRSSVIALSYLVREMYASASDRLVSPCSHGCLRVTRVATLVRVTGDQSGSPCTCPN